MSNASTTVDARPSFWLDDVNGVDLVGIKLPPRAGPALNDVADFRMFGTSGVKDLSIAGPVSHSEI
jgi:hypothetical protein